MTGKQGTGNRQGQRQRPRAKALRLREAMIRRAEALRSLRDAEATAKADTGGGCSARPSRARTGHPHCWRWKPGVGHPRMQGTGNRQGRGGRGSVRGCPHPCAIGPRMNGAPKMILWVGHPPFQWTNRDTYSEPTACIRYSRMTRSHAALSCSSNGCLLAASLESSTSVFSSLSFVSKGWVLKNITL